MNIDLEKSTPLLKYKILSNTITPRPIAWISTISEGGVDNLAPFSFFGVVSPDPVVFSICFTPKSDSSPKDTLRNILETKKATLCLCTSRHIDNLKNTSSELVYGVSEASNFGIELEIVQNGYPPMVSGVECAFLCDFCDSFYMGKNSQAILLEAKSCFIDEKIYMPNINFVLQNIGRVGKFFQLPSHNLV